MRVSLFLGKVVWGKLPTRHILREKGIDIQMIYPNYRAEKETVEHMLFLCPSTKRVWLLVGLHHRIIQVEDPIEVFINLLRRRVGMMCPERLLFGLLI